MPPDPSTAGMIPVATETGGIRYISPEDVEQAAEAGMMAPTPEQMHQEAERKFYSSDPLAMTGAALGGVGKSILPLGLFEKSVIGLGGLVGGEEEAERQRQGLAAAARYNPGLDIAGQVGGLALGGALMRGAAGVAKLATPMGIISEAGNVASKGVGSIIGTEASGVLARAAQKGIAGAAGVGLEGAIYGAGQELSEAAVQNREVDAEKLLAGAKHGLEFGAALGGVGAAAASLTQSAVKGLGGIATKSLEGTSLGEKLDQMSGEAATRSVRGNKRMTENLDTYGPGAAETGKILREEMPELAGKEHFGQMTFKDMKPAAEKGLEREGTKIGDYLKKLDGVAAETGTQARVGDVLGDFQSARNKLESEIHSPAAASALSEVERQFKKITGITEDAASLDKPITFSEIQKIRKKMDKLITWTPELKGAGKELAELRGSLESRLENGFKSILGDEALKEYATAKEKYQAFMFAKKAASLGKASASSNLAITLTEKLAASTGGQIGGAIGGIPGAALGGAVGYFGAKLAREKGEFLVSHILGMAGKSGAAEKAIAAVDSRVATGVQEFLKTSRRAAFQAKFGRRDDESIADKATKVREIAKDPALLQAYVQRSIGKIDHHSPELTQAVSARVQNDIQYLASKVPPPPKISNITLTPKVGNKQRFNKEDLLSFTEAMDGISNPMSLLDDLSRGIISRSKVDAVKATRPAVFAQIQQDIVMQAAELEDKLPYSKEVLISLLFDTPVTPTMDPKFIKAMQSTAETAPPAPEPKPSAKQGGGRRPIDLESSIYQPETESIATGRD